MWQPFAIKWRDIPSGNPLRLGILSISNGRSKRIVAGTNCLG
jgi:hypothetical protein